MTENAERPDIAAELPPRSWNIAEQLLGMGPLSLSFADVDGAMWVVSHFNEILIVFTDDGPVDNFAVYGLDFTTRQIGTYTAKEFSVLEFAPYDSDEPTAPTPDIGLTPDTIVEDMDYQDNLNLSRPVGDNLQPLENVLNQIAVEYKLAV